MEIKALPLEGHSTDLLAAGTGGEVLDAPGSSRAPAGAYAEVSYGERRGVHPVHEHSAWQPVTHRHPAASPLHQELLELIRIHQPGCGDRHLCQEFQCVFYNVYLFAIDTINNNSGKDI